MRLVCDTNSSCNFRSDIFMVWVPFFISKIWLVLFQISWSSLDSSLPKVNCWIKTDPKISSPNLVNMCAWMVFCSFEKLNSFPVFHPWKTLSLLFNQESFMHLDYLEFFLFFFSILLFNSLRFWTPYVYQKEKVLWEKRTVLQCSILKLYFPPKTCMPAVFTEVVFYCGKTYINFAISKCTRLQH